MLIARIEAATPRHHFGHFDCIYTFRKQDTRCKCKHNSIVESRYHKHPGAEVELCFLVSLSPRNSPH